MCAVKELATSMSSPTLCSLQRMRKVVGYLKASGDTGVKLVDRRRTVLVGGNIHRRRLVSEQATQTIYEQCYTLCEWKLCLCLLKESACCFSVLSRERATQHCFRLFRWDHFQWTDNSAARQLVSRQGVGRIRHLSCCGFRIWFRQSSLQWARFLRNGITVMLGRSPCQDPA